MINFTEKMHVCKISDKCGGKKEKLSSWLYLMDACELRVAANGCGLFNFENSNNFSLVWKVDTAFRNPCNNSVVTEYVTPLCRWGCMLTIKGKYVSASCWFAAPLCSTPAGFLKVVRERHWIIALLLLGNPWGMYIAVVFSKGFQKIEEVFTCSLRAKLWEALRS